MFLLPSEYKSRMKIILKDEYERFIQSYDLPHYRGIRLNILKCDIETLTAALPYKITPAPFSPLSYYLPPEAEKIGSLPMHHAGAFYSQEPSAASAVTALDPQPGERVLDLCAAPGGKSTQIAALLQGKGLLWSNEVVRSRANILLSNMERCGVANAVVSSCHPDLLCSSLAGYFDRVLVDAPCSGEGMFRRDEQAVQDWSPEHVQACSVRQLAILESASLAVKENGILTYSTCTFSPEENEGVVEAFLKRHSDFDMVERTLSFGRPAGIPQARRIYPMDGGEGHFVAVLRRNSPNPSISAPYELKKNTKTDAAGEMLSEVFKQLPMGRIEQVGDTFLLLPDILPELKNLGVIRAGVMLGEAKKNRVEPAHALFMVAKPEQFNTAVNLSHDSPEISAFLRGEEISVESTMRGYVGVAVDGVMTGFGKCSGGRLKNHYPKGLRNN